MQVSEIYYKITSQGSNNDGQRKAFSNPTHPSRRAGVFGSFKGPNCQFPNEIQNRCNCFQFWLWTSAMEADCWRLSHLSLFAHQAGYLSLAYAAFRQSYRVTSLPLAAKEEGRHRSGWYLYSPIGQGLCSELGLFCFLFRNLRQYRDGY